MGEGDTRMLYTKQEKTAGNRKKNNKDIIFYIKHKKNPLPGLAIEDIEIYRCNNV